MMKKSPLRSSCAERDDSHSGDNRHTPSVARAAGIQIRLYSAQDNISAITELLHRAYRSLAHQGLRFVATWQGDDITMKRIGRGQTYLALSEDEIVGTITLYERQHTSGCAWYDRDEVCSLGQFAVCPKWQGLGLDCRLLRTAEQEAARTGAAEIALDTAEQASRLVQFYTNQGYRPVGHAQWDCTNFRSVIMSKSVPVGRAKR